MRIEVVVPPMGDSIAGGTLVAWLKKAGETVRRGEDLFTLSTDKVDADIPSPVDGLVEQIVVEPGTPVKVGEVVAILETESLPERDADRRSAAASSRLQKEKPGQAGGRKPRRSAGPGASRHSAEMEAQEEALLARSGTSPRGLARGTGRMPAFLPDRGDASEYWSGPSSGLDRSALLRQAPGQTVWECDWSQAVKVQRSLSGEYQQRGVQLTMTAFLVQAVVHGLRSFPLLNSTFDGERVLRSGRINIGISDLVPGEPVGPVIPRADELSLLGVARIIDELIDRVRTHRLGQGDLEGATFAINNPDACECFFRLPTIASPLVAALGAGAIRPRVVADESGSIRVAHMNLLCLSFDSRVIGPGMADSFMKVVVRFLEGEEIVKYLRA